MDIDSIFLVLGAGGFGFRLRVADLLTGKLWDVYSSDHQLQRPCCEAHHPISSANAPTLRILVGFLAPCQLLRVAVLAQPGDQGAGVGRWCSGASSQAGRLELRFLCTMTE